MNIKETVRSQISNLVDKAIADCGFESVNYQVETPREKANGDFSTNAAMLLTKIAKTFRKKAFGSSLFELFRRICKSCEIVERKIVVFRQGDKVMHRHLALSAFVKLILLPCNT